MEAIGKTSGANKNEPSLQEAPELESWSCRVPQKSPRGSGVFTAVRSTLAGNDPHIE